MRKENKLNISREDIAGALLIGSGILSLFGISARLSEAHLSPAAIATADGLLASASVGVAAGMIKSFITDRHRDYAESPINLRKMMPAAIAFGAAAAGTGTGVGIISYPHYVLEKNVRETIQALPPSRLVPVKLPRSKMGKAKADSITCPSFVFEFKDDPYSFRGDDGRGGVVIAQADQLYRVNCIPYIRAHKDELPKPH